MKTLKAWIGASRLHTLPLSISGIIMGSSMAYREGYFSVATFVLSLLTAVALQILSNFANDYGDFKKGADRNRIGPKRSVQSGLISEKNMKLGIYITITVTILMVLGLVFLAFGRNPFYLIVFVVLGILAIAAAICYTMGKNPYGYYGYGDLFVFLFFGLLSVCGSYFLYTKSINYRVLLPATSLGLLSVAVLNLNNMRDYESDKASAKKTMVVRIGPEISKQYHYMLLLVAMSSLMLFSLLSLHKLKQLLYLPMFVPLVLHIRTVAKNKDAKQLNPELKKVAICTFFLTLLFALGQCL